MSCIGLAYCGAMALIGQSKVGSMAHPRKRNFPHTCCMNFLSFMLRGGASDSCVAYCALSPYIIGNGKCAENVLKCW